jgi:hypothetical protein
MLEELSRRLQSRNDPLGSVSLFIMTLALYSRGEISKQLLISNEDEPVERNVWVLRAVCSFYAYLILLLATRHLTAPQIEHLGDHVATLVSHTVISFYCAHFADDAKQKMTDDFSKEVIVAFTGYASVVRNTQGTLREMVETSIRDLLSRASSDVAQAWGRLDDVSSTTAIEYHLFIGYTILVEATRLDKLFGGIPSAIAAGADPWEI